MNELEKVKQELSEAKSLLSELAAMPLEEFGLADKPDNRVLWGANDWQFTVGMIKKAMELTK